MNQTTLSKLMVHQGIAFSVEAQASRYEEFELNLPWTLRLGVKS